MTKYQLNFEDDSHDITQVTLERLNFVRRKHPKTTSEIVVQAGQTR